MLAKFKYEDKITEIQFNSEDSAQSVCNHFTSKAFLNIDDLNFKFEEKLLDLELPLISQLDLPENKNEIEIVVIKKENTNEQHNININIAGINTNMIIKKGESIFNAISSIYKTASKKLILLYNGKILDENEQQKTFYQVANKDSQKSNMMNIIAYEIDDIKDNDEIEKESNINDFGEIKEGKVQILEKNSYDEKNIIEHIRKKTRIFLIKVYLWLLIQYIFITIVTFLGLHFEFDEILLNSKSIYYITCFPILLFTIIAASNSVEPYKKENLGFSTYFSYIIFIPMMSLFFLFLKIDIIRKINFEDRYIFYLLIIFISDFLFLIIYNLMIQKYRNWLNFIILSLLNFLIIYIYSYWISIKYENLKVNKDGIISLSFLSSIMIVYITIFNGEILSKITYEPLYIANNFHNILIFVGIMIILLLVIYRLIQFILNMIFLLIGVAILIYFILAIFA